MTQGLSERDICTKFILPALEQAGWDRQSQLFEEYPLRVGRVFVRGNKGKRDPGTVRRADYVLFHKPGIPLAVIEAKDNTHSIRDGIQQALAYADMLDVPFAFSSNGDGFLFHDRTAADGVIERELTLAEFPSPAALWARYTAWKNLPAETAPLLAQDYHPGKRPRYYQINAINRAIEAVASRQRRLLLVMATGTGKTFTAFQIIWRLWKGKAARRILFLADRNILIDQTKVNDFQPFGGAMTKIENRQADPAYEIYLSLYQAVTGNEEEKNIYKQFSPDFFDLVVVDECHRGSAAEDSAWREVLDYFSSAIHLGLTATPKETAEVSNISYFGEPVYTYSLRQGIEDGYLAPYKVIRIDLDKDLGWRPTAGKTDKHGQLVEDRIYNRSDINKTLVLEQRDVLVAERITALLKATDRYAKTIVFCEDIDHAARMRQALINANADLAAKNPKYVVQITGDNEEGKRELDNFIDPEKPYPVIATTSRLMNTGVDAQTCKLIVLDRTINSMTEFKQIIGRGTRTRETSERLSSYRLSNGDIVLARRGEVGRCAIVSAKEEGWLCGTGSFFLKLPTMVNRDFLYLLFQSPDIRRYLSEGAVGATMVNLNQRILVMMPIGLPPLPEQSRIVAAVASLTAICDRLRERLAARRALSAKLAAALTESALA